MGKALAHTCCRVKGTAGPRTGTVLTAGPPHGITGILPFILQMKRLRLKDHTLCVFPSSLTGELSKLLKKFKIHRCQSRMAFDLIALGPLELRSEEEADLPKAVRDGQRTCCVPPVPPQFGGILKTKLGVEEGPQMASRRPSVGLGLHPAGPRLLDTFLTCGKDAATCGKCRNKQPHMASGCCHTKARPG